MLHEARSFVEVAVQYGRALFLPPSPKAEKVLFFIGYPRSGHSLVGSLLDAHREIVVAHELGLVRCVHAGMPPQMITKLLVDKARKDADKKRFVGRYCYDVTGQWQGQSQNARIIGDKHGQGASLRLAQRPWLLDRVRSVFQCPIRVIHVVRNPYDNITTILARGGRPNLAGAIEYYFELVKCVTAIQLLLDKTELVSFRSEDFIADARGHLRRLCAFLGVNVFDDWVEACAKIVFPEPKQTRRHVSWSTPDIERVRDRIAETPWLNDYSYEP